MDDAREWDITDNSLDEIDIEPVIIDAKEEPEEALKQLFRRAAPFAGMQIIEIAKGRKESRVQFDAAKYVVERVWPSNPDKYDDPEDTIEKQFVALSKLFKEESGGEA